MATLRRAVLTDFRNYRRCAFEPGPGINVVTGPNGSGKTNLLEAISLLGPGAGLRHARTDALPRAGGTGVWGVAATVEAAGAVRDIGTGIVPDEAGGSGGGRAGPGRAVPLRRLFRLDGVPVRAGAALLDLFPVLWLTPQMERLWGEPPSGRRRFLDRLVTSLDPAHARTLAAHDRSVQTRNRLLAERRSEHRWLAAAEDSIARHAVAAAAARSALCRRLNEDGPISGGGAFPAASLRLLDTIADRLAAEPARIVEDEIRRGLALCRDEDARAGATSVGAHRADLAIADRASGLDGADASTGQQKALLIGIVLAHASLVLRERDERPVLLLDEPLVHLDERRRDALCRDLATLALQAVLTGTDPYPFAPLGPDARHFVTEEGALRPAPRWPSSG